MRNSVAVSSTGGLVDQHLVSHGVDGDGADAEHRLVVGAGLRRGAARP